MAIGLRVNLSIIIKELFEMDVLKNSNESVLIGILNMYTASAGLADRILLDIMRKVDQIRALNVLSSLETWNAFKNSWSRYEVEAVGSTLSTPFSVIGAETTSQNILAFDISFHYGGNDSDDSIAYARYDPRFWLPIIGYCLEKTSHQTNIMLLIDSSAIGYALVCLSSKNEEIRHMASSLVIRWEHLCQVSFFRRVS